MPSSAVESNGSPLRDHPCTLQWVSITLSSSVCTKSNVYCFWPFYPCLHSQHSSVILNDNYRIVALLAYIMPVPIHPSPGPWCPLSHEQLQKADACLQPKQPQARPLHLPVWCGAEWVAHLAHNPAAAGECSSWPQHHTGLLCAGCTGERHGCNGPSEAEWRILYIEAVCMYVCHVVSAFWKGVLKLFTW